MQCLDVLLCIAIFAVLSNAQNYNFTSQVRIYDNTAAGAPAIAIAAFGGPDACTNKVLTLRNSATLCAATLSNDTYVVSLQACPPSLVGATALSCVSSVCFALNPVLKTIAVITKVTLAAITVAPATIDISALTTPKVFSAYQAPAATTVDLLVVDASTNAVVKYTYTIATGATSPSPITASFTGTPIGILSTATTFFVGIAGATQLSSFPIGGGGATPFGPIFGNIGAISLDGFGNIHVYDASTSRINIVNPGSTIITTISTLSAPIYLSNSRLRIYAVDAAGITKFEDVVQLIYSSTPVTCATRNGSVTTQVSSGDAPYIVVLLPDALHQSLSTSGQSVTFNTNLPSQQGYPLMLLDDTNARILPVVGGVPLTRRGWTSDTAHTGNLSYWFNFTTNFEQINFAIPSAGLDYSISGSQFEYFEFWLNIGAGGQTFLITLGNLQETYTPGDLPLNTWVQFKYTLPRIRYRIQQVTTLFVQGVGIRNTAPTGPQNVMYFDTFFATPYNSTIPDRNVYVFDRCGATTHSVVPFTYKPFEVSTSSTATSCNIASTASTTYVSDGTITAHTSNGVGPFTYNWTFPTSLPIVNSPTNTSTITGLLPKNSFVSIYENSLNSSWADLSISTSYSFSDTRYFRSPPTSISFTALAEGDAIVLSASTPLAYSDFPVVEFWINGGPTGGQTITVYIFRTTIPASGTGTINKQIAPGAVSGYASIPKNTWIKVSIPVTGDTSDKFNLISIVSTLPISTNPIVPSDYIQNTVWIDDLVLLSSKGVVSVTDVTGCMASTVRARVDAPPVLTQSVSVENVKCYGRSEGSISVQMNGGTPPYNYSWGGNVADTSSVRNGLFEGKVNISVNDAKQCQYKEYVATVLQPPELKVTQTTIPPKCFGGSGSILASAAGGTGLYTYSWTSPAGSPQVVLHPAPEPIFLDAPTVPFALKNAQTVCAGTGLNQTSFSPSHSGYCSMYLNFANASVAGIVGCGDCISPSKYASVTFSLYVDTQSALDNLYVGFVRGNASNFVSNTVSVSSLGATLKTWSQITLQLSLAQLDSHPDGIMFNSTAPGNMGVVIVDDVVVLPTAAFGSGFATYTGFVSEISAVAAQYYLTVVDNNGCGSPLVVTVTQPEALRINSSVTSPSSVGGSDGSITVQGAGGTPPYTYLWEGGLGTSPTISNLKSGAYEVTVTDANNCTFTDRVPNTYDDTPYVRAYNSRMSGGLGAIAGGGALIALFSFLMIVRFWASFSTLGSFFSSTILLGCGLAFASALVLLPQPTDSLCVAFPWLLGVGFALVYGCLFIKTWSLYGVWRKAVQYHKAKLTPGDIVRNIGIVVLIEITFLAIWTGVEPPKAYLVSVINNSQEWQCDVEHPTFWLIFLIVKGGWLIFGAVLSILTRNIAREYNESTSIAYAIYNNVVLGAIAIPLVVLLKETPGARVVVEVVVIVLAFTFTLVIMFFKIWHNILLPDRVIAGQLEAATKRTTASSSGVGSKSKNTSSGDGKTSSAGPYSP